MSFSNQKRNLSQLKSLCNTELSKEEQQKVKGGFLFKMIDDIRCSFDRSFSRLTGGNGDGDW